jgi:hypothetical protein
MGIIELAEDLCSVMADDPVKVKEVRYLRKLISEAENGRIGAENRLKRYVSGSRII